MKCSSGSSLDLSSALDGEIHLLINEENVDKFWIVLFHANGRPIVGRVPDQKEVVSRGSQIRFPTFMALIISCVISPYGSIRFPPDSSVFNKAANSQTSEKIRGLHWKVRFRGHSNQQSVLFNHGIVLIRPDAKRLVR